MEITKKMYELAKLIVTEYEKKLSGGLIENNFIDNHGNIYNKQGVKIKDMEVVFEVVEYNKRDFNKECTTISDKAQKALKPHRNDYTTSVIDCYESCLSQFPIDLRPSTMSEQVKWLDEIDKLNRLDHLQYSDIILLTKCAREDKFWSKNFLTLRKLRRKNKDGIPHWKLFRENFKFEQSKTQEVQSAYEQAKERLGI